MPDSRPNMVLVLTDHWRGDSLGRLGHPFADTPHLDSISAGGVTFTNAYTPCPSCIAARRSLWTGMSPDSHGMLGYQDGRPWPYEHSLAGELARSGYQTINVGKTHFHPPRLHLGFEELTVPGDFDEWLEKETGLVRAKFAHGVPGNSWIARPSHIPETQMEETWFTNRAMQRLEKRDPTRPFFLCLSFKGPHPPWCPPRSFFDRFMDVDMPAPVVGEWAQSNAEEARYPMDANAARGKLSPEDNQRARAGYYAYLAYLDSQIGRFVEYLGRSGSLGNTWLVFSSDHGEMLGDHHLWRKTYAYDPSARIPLLVKPPGAWECEKNIENDAPVGWEDLMPTFLEAAGVEIPDTVEGESLISLLREEEAPWRSYYHHEHSPCYAGENAYQSLVSREWKYVWNPINGREQLFRREEDPHELCDLAPEPEYAEVLGKWRTQLAKELQGRPEGLSDGETLQTGEVPVWRDPRER